MLRLPITLVNPSSIKVRFNTLYLRGDMVYGKLESGKSWIQFDVMTGIMEPIEYSEVRARLMEDKDWMALTANHDCTPSGDASNHSTSGRPSVMSKLLAYREATNQDISEEYARSLTMISNEGMRLLVALINHQVKGDDVIKGLRAIGIRPSFKLVENYLGGWNVTSDKCDCVEDMVLDIMNQRGK